MGKSSGFLPKLGLDEVKDVRIIYKLLAELIERAKLGQDELNAAGLAFAIALGGE